MEVGEAPLAATRSMMASLQRLGRCLLMRKRAMPSTRSSAANQVQEGLAIPPKSPMFTR